MSATEAQIRAVLKKSTRNWDGWCQALVWNVCNWFGHAPHVYSSAIEAYHASKIVSKDPHKAPGGAIHYWDLGIYGHVAVGLGGERVLMASSHIAHAWGDNVGDQTVTQYGKLVPKAKYLGWANSNGVNDFTFVVPKPPAPKLKPNQRKAKVTTNSRDLPSTKSKIISNIQAGHVGNFKAYLHAEKVAQDGYTSDIWFQGSSGNWFWSGGFEDRGTHDLKNVTPAPKPTIGATQRKVDGEAVLRRSLPSTKSKEAGAELKAGEVGNFNGWTHGQKIAGNDVWFRGISNNWFWSGAFVDKGTHDLPYVEPPKAPAGEYKLEDPKAAHEVNRDAENVIPHKVDDSQSLDYNFDPDFDCVTEVIPVPWENFDQDKRFPANPKKVVIHQFGTPGVDTFESVLNWFTNPEAETSAHFVVSGKNIVQMVSLADRAWHAGPAGNDFVGIETDPQQDEDTIASVRTLLEALRDRYDHVLEPIKHSSIAATACGSFIVMENYQIDAEPPAPEPEPEPEPEPTPEPTSDPVDPSKEEQVKMLVDQIAQLTGQLQVLLSSE